MSLSPLVAFSEVKVVLLTITAMVSPGTWICLFPPLILNVLKTFFLTHTFGNYAKGNKRIVHSILSLCKRITLLMDNNMKCSFTMQVP